ncbi:MAG: hypothetical protein EP335_18025 [Alphaproteobacteria bacterium]|nr:MAG: hypothetical protein EP335_18025 [Alphaproteobacteria bacterium]
MLFRHLLFIVALMGLVQAGPARAEPGDAHLQEALDALQEGRFRVADDLINQLIADTQPTPPYLVYYSAQAAFGRGQYRRAKGLVNDYLGRPPADLLYVDEAKALALKIEAALTAFATSDQAAFEFARKQHTIFAYAAYRDQYPDGDNIANADTFSFQRAKELNMEASYQRYVAYWPEGQYVREATRAADTASFRQARQQNTIISYQTYLSDYPAGQFVDQASQRQESLAYYATTRDGSVAAFKAFLAQYPKGANRANALKALEAAQKLAPQRDLTGPTVTIQAGILARGKPMPKAASQAARLVEIPGPFMAMAYEVTFDQWDACVADGGCGGYRPADMGWGRISRPVINVGRTDVDGFIAWFNAKWKAAGGTGQWRLPSETEWTYMARGMNAQVSMQRATLENARGNCAQCSDSSDPQATNPVGALAPNSFGLYDMLGNVGEWVADCWLDSFINAPSDGSPWIQDGCDTGTVRGATNSSTPVFFAVQARQPADWDLRSMAVGFRLVMSLPPAPKKN